MHHRSSMPTSSHDLKTSHRRSRASTMPTEARAVDEIRSALAQDKAAARVAAAARGGTTRCWSTPASTTTTSCRASSSTSSALPRPEHRARARRRAEHRADRRACWRRSSALLAARRAGRGARLRRHELDAGRRAGGARRRGVPVAHVEAGMRSLRPRACPRSSTACSPTTLATLLLCSVADGRRQPARRAGRRARSRSSAT